MKTVAESMINSLISWNVKSFYSIAADSLNFHEQIKWIFLRHKESEAIATVAETQDREKENFLTPYSEIESDCFQETNQCSQY